MYQYVLLCIKTIKDIAVKMDNNIINCILYVFGNEKDQNYSFKRVYVYIIIKLLVLSGPTWVIYWTSMLTVI